MSEQDPQPTVVSVKQWQDMVEEKMRVVTRSLVIGFLIFAIGMGYAVWRNHDLATSQAKQTQQNAEQTKQVAALARQNAVLIRDTAKAGYQADLVGWNACMDRNKRAKEGLVQFRKLVTAHSKDKSTNAVRVWKMYLRSQERNKLPPCGTKPSLAPQPDPRKDIPSIPTTTVPRS